MSDKMRKIYGPRAEYIRSLRIINESQMTEDIRWKYTVPKIINESLIADNLSLKIYGPWKFNVRTEYQKIYSPYAENIRSPNCIYTVLKLL